MESKSHGNKKTDNDVIVSDQKKNVPKKGKSKRNTAFVSEVSSEKANTESEPGKKLTQAQEIVRSVNILNDLVRIIHLVIY